MKKGLSIVVCVVLLTLPAKSYSQKWARIFDIAAKTVVTVLEVAEYVEIAAVLIASEDDLEYWLNQTINNQIQRNYSIYSSEWLTAIGNNMVANCNRPILPKGLRYSFMIIDVDDYNAFAVPGGSVYVTKPLFDALNEEEMAFVLGHEIAHIIYKHSIKKVKASHAFLALEKIGLKLLKADRDVEQMLDILAAGVYSTIQTGFSREWERDADKYGCNLAYMANYDPNSSVEALRKIADASGSWSACCFLWDTHPTMTERIQLLNIQIAALDTEMMEEHAISEEYMATNISPEITGEYTGSSVFQVGYNSISDRETRYNWMIHYDNPSSMLRYQMENHDNNQRLPRFEELVTFFDKLICELNTSREGAVLAQVFLEDGNYISSTITYSPENKMFYRGIYWNSATRSYSSVNLASGDLVNLIYINK